MSYGREGRRKEAIGKADGDGQGNRGKGRGRKIYNIVFVSVMGQIGRLAYVKRGKRMWKREREEKKESEKTMPCLILSRGRGRAMRGKPEINNRLKGSRKKEERGGRRV